MATTAELNGPAPPADGGEQARSVPRTARERARAEITSEILEAGRRHLATDGAAALSLRAIARELGMASSAVYRYVASRDDLLTRLIIDAYNSLGAAAEAADCGRRPCGLVRPVVGDLPGGQELGAGESERVGADLRLARSRVRGACRHDRAGQPGLEPPGPDPRGVGTSAGSRCRIPPGATSAPPPGPRSRPCWPSCRQPSRTRRFRLA